MRPLINILGILILCSCKTKVDVEHTYEKYYNDATWEIYKQAGNNYTNGNYLAADSLYGIVISSSSHNLTSSMPNEMNPYYYKAAIAFELMRHDSAIYYFNKLNSINVDSSILMMRAESYRMLNKLDSCLLLCNKSLDLGYDSSITLLIRGSCYFELGKFDKACKDLQYAKLHGIESSELTKQLTKCK